MDTTHMKHTYRVTGMSCKGCKSHVEESLEQLPEVVSAQVNLAEGTVEVEMSSHLQMDKLQETLADSQYAIHPADHPKEEKKLAPMPAIGGANYYCPMHCEGDKVYKKPGDCPVCGMDLVPEVSAATSSATQYTCPMHPEVVSDKPGSCPECGMDLVPKEPDASAEEKTYQRLVRKFKIATGFTLPIFLIAMSEMLPNNPIYQWMPLQYWNWVQLLLSIPVVFYATWMFFQRAYTSIVTSNYNMFTLIGIGAGVAWLFSVFGLLFPEVFPDQFRTHTGSIHMYFESATVILTLVLLGQVLEARAHSKTNSAVKELLKLAPSRAVKIIDGEEIEISIDDIAVGDLLRVKPGDKVPVDGEIKEGSSTIDESMITGEPMPVDKQAGDKVSAGTINGKQSFSMTAKKIGTDTLLSQIIDLVNSASRSKAPIQKLADKISGYFVPAVVAVSVITFVVWVVFGPEPKWVYALVNAIAVLIIACPCALGLATPMSVMVGVGKGAELGVLIKNAASLETMNKVDVVIIDKTGTVTEGRPTVEEVVAIDFDKKQLIQQVASVNQQSEHPLAEATVRYAKEEGVTLQPITDFDSVTGKGVVAKADGQLTVIGNEKLLLDYEIKLTDVARESAMKHQSMGRTVSYVAVDGRLAGLLAIGDKIKPTSKQAINDLKARGMEVIMMTGDQSRTAQAVGDELALDEVIADCLPADKMEKVKALQAEGKIVAMAGDGINDAPALALADVGVAMGTGTDVAIESAAITLVKGDLHGIVKARILSEKVMRNIKQNLFFALLYNGLGVPLAAGVLFPVFGILLSPMIAALAMSFSSVSVITNALRLKAAKIV